MPLNDIERIQDYVDHANKTISVDIYLRRGVDNLNADEMNQMRKNLQARWSHFVQRGYHVLNPRLRRKGMFWWAR